MHEFNKYKSRTAEAFISYRFVNLRNIITETSNFYKVYIIKSNLNKFNTLICTSGAFVQLSIDYHRLSSVFPIIQKLILISFTELKNFTAYLF